MYSLILTIRLSLITVSTVVSFGTQLIAAAYASVPLFQSSSASAELTKDLEQLDLFLSNRDLHFIEATVHRTSAKWKERDRASFLGYMLKACSLLSSYNIGDMSDRASLLSRYAISVLTSGDLPISDRVQFTEFLMFDPPSIGEKDWKSLREQKARLWLETWHRVASSVDPTFNIDDRPLPNVPTPLGSGVPSGGLPDSIKDPKLRADYERAIAQNSAKARRFNDQYWLLRNVTHFGEDTERYLVNAYSGSPADSAQLEGLLTEYVRENAVRARILEDVRKGRQ